MGKIKIQKKDVWIDMTPMSDVMVLLLTFFMLTSTFMQPEPVKVETPSAVTESKIPEQNILTILVSNKGKVFLGTENKAHMAEMLQTMMSVFPDDLKLTNADMKKFKEDAMVGVGVDKLAGYLRLEPDKMSEFIQTQGVPLDSISGGMSQFQEWVKAARDVNSDMKIAIKCDGQTSYTMVKKVMSELQDMNENRYQLITTLKTTED